jgi:transcriptional regulator with XRE-family HTH domain
MGFDEKDLLREIGMRIADRRKGAKMSQARLAQLIGQTPGSVGSYETGRILPSITALFKIANAIGIHPATLLGFDGADLDWGEQEVLRRYRELDDAGKFRCLNDRNLI